jgi:hypothetical protein
VGADQGAAVHSLACDHYTALVGLTDGTARLFQLASGQLLASLDCSPEVPGAPHYALWPQLCNMHYALRTMTPTMHYDPHYALCTMHHYPHYALCTMIATIYAPRAAQARCGAGWATGSWRRPPPPAGSSSGTGTDSGRGDSPYCFKEHCRMTVSVGRKAKGSLGREDSLLSR